MSRAASEIFALFSKLSAATLAFFSPVHRCRRRSPSDHVEATIGVTFLLGIKHAFAIA
ncbi:hypothetical protein P0R27_28460 [Bradyrhizobium yuanmingense]|nr:hypothetical protein [Bradyrhizobium yuanmingense]MDF0497244.1 hypothetical protein [Bradyrhizobium yuanmingense]MDF0521054.1 hypothetical protein [Bradyrhizobium yuanmingense]